MKEQTFSIQINNEEYAYTPNQSILEVAKAHKYYIPHVCYHENLGAIQSCDTCMVEVDGELKRACATAAIPGMRVDSKSKRAKDAQMEAMQRLLQNHELYCTVCDNNNGNCTVHNTAEYLQVEHQKYEFAPKPYPPDNTHPFYRYEPDQCILCGRCVEACQDLQVNETLTIDWSLERPRVLWDNGVPIDQSSCVSCGHCITVCPCNALMEKTMLGEAGYLTGIPNSLLLPMIDLTKEVEPSYQEIFAISEVEAAMRKSRIERTKTVCTYCGVGCSFEVWTKDREILKIEPQVEAPVNGISTCIKGKFGWDFVNSEERLTKPLIRKGDVFVEATWDEALNLIATKLKEMKETYGPDSIGYIASSKCSNEENFIFQKFARAVMGSNNLDNCSRYCQSPATAGLMRTVGIGGDSGTIVDIASAELVLVVGANPAESHPVLATRVKRAHKLHGQKLVVVDLRKHELGERADLFLRPKPGSDLIWLSAVTKYILEQGWEDREFLKQRVNGYEEYVQSLEPYTLEYAEERTGLTKENIIQIATMIHESKSTCILWAMGVTQHIGATDTSTAISNLLLITGNYGRPGTGAYPLRGHNNVQGACDFGTMPAWFPGYEAIQDEKVRARYERAWGVKLPEKPGMNNHQMVEGIHDGKLKAMYLFGEDMALVDSNSNHVQAAFEKLEFFVVQDIFFSKTAQFADVVLPAAPSLEKDGTFTNTERRIQRFYKVFEPLGDSKPDWEIIQEIANRFGANWNYKHPSELMDEAASLAPIFAGVSYERLEGWKSLVWPVAANGVDTPLLYLEKFGFPDGKAKLFPVQWTPPYEAGEGYDLHLNNGRLLEHFHEGNMTYKSKGITHKVPSEWLEVSPELAKERGIDNGALVRLTSPYGVVEVRVEVTDRVKGNELYLTMNSAEDLSAVNRLTSSYHDRITHTPNYKEMGVKMEVLEAKGERPLPRVNHRFGNRVPQLGVKVEEKWERSDYIPISEIIDGGASHGEGNYQH
ncbi:MULTISPECIES: formate dehydrogenase subunit alpha [unclassified Paenibacillus]|uniref:formate dehydrogenase subunit alpha n=1 Tax=unclassified Paenibacillus TaxID=185978 RepID=UPI001AE3DDE0|nr:MULTISPECIES: formate dehydrogenase subunit alpha [unclassified Paenibacillus]MBP1153783.1 formate dehydrogenase major subunit [Paenibacillus sp. PvP091]MBP1170832.1 formate dehydrogenase major subunit [Paenibacillus sp. PvR098]MBP2441860.1 formate dehydrogenase major subunit [Paenibacillus sp. PvP052]